MLRGLENPQNLFQSSLFITKANSNGYKILATDTDAKINDHVILRTKGQKQGGGWEKPRECIDGWMKIRDVKSRQFLHLDEETKKLTIRPNVKPCQGRKPCLR